MTLRLNQTLRSLAYVKLNFNLPSAAWYELNPQKLRTNLDPSLDQVGQEEVPLAGMLIMNTLFWEGPFIRK